MTLEEFIKFLKLKSKDDFTTLWVYCMEGEYATAQITVEDAYENFLDSFTDRTRWATIDEFVAAGHECYELKF